MNFDHSSTCVVKKKNWVGAWICCNVWDRFLLATSLTQILNYPYYSSGAKLYRHCSIFAVDRYAIINTKCFGTISVRNTKFGTEKCGVRNLAANRESDRNLSPSQVDHLQFIAFRGFLGRLMSCNRLWISFGRDWVPSRTSMPLG